MMDGRLRTAAFLATWWLALGVPAAIHAQGTWDAMLTVQPFPSPYFSDWDTNPNIGSLTILNHTGSAEDVRIFFTITDRMNRVIAHGRSEPEMIAAGSVAIYDSPYEIAGSGSHDAELERIASRTGRLPEGDYTACASAADASGFVLAEACADFFIAYPDPPLLLAPDNGAELTDEAPLFQWTPVQVPIEYQVAYALRIVEVLPSQLPGEALTSNIPVHEERDAFGTSLRYPIDALPLETGKLYAWSVRALDQHGYAASGNEGRSEIWTFRVDDGSQVDGPVPSRTLTMMNDPGDGDTGSGTVGKLDDICSNWDDPPHRFTLGLNVQHGFLRGETVVPTELYQDDSTRTWGLLGERSGVQYLLYGDCERGGVLGGLRWIARRKPGPQPLMDFLNILPPLDPAAGGEFGMDFGVMILALGSTTAEVPAKWRAGSEFMHGHAIDVSTGLNLFGILSLREHAMWSFFEELGYTEKTLELQGFLGLQGSWSVGGFVGRTVPDAGAPGHTEDAAAAELSRERTFMVLRGALPRKAPPIMTGVFETMQWGIELIVQDSTAWTASTGSGEAGNQGVSLDLIITPTLTLTTHGGVEFKGAIGADVGYQHQPLAGWARSRLGSSADSAASFGETPGVGLVLKLSSDGRLPLGATAFYVGNPELEIDVDEGLIRVFREGPRALDWSATVSGSLGYGSVESIAAVTVGFGRKADNPMARSAAATQTRMDSIRAVIAAREAEIQAAVDAGATAEADRLRQLLAIDRNALAMWEAQPPDTAGATATGADSSARGGTDVGAWHWGARAAFGNMPLGEFLQAARALWRRETP